MVSGFPGHNKGKKFVPGVGYVTPKRERIVSTCKGCGAAEPPRRRIFASGKQDCAYCYYVDCVNACRADPRDVEIDTEDGCVIE
jgi:hypothetical protein